MTHQNKYKIRKGTFLSFLLIFLFLISSANADDRYWVASGSGDKIWNDNNNWSDTDGGSPGHAPPSNGDRALSPLDGGACPGDPPSVSDQLLLSFQILSPLPLATQYLSSAFALEIRNKKISRNERNVPFLILYLF